jgi:hypothetical protein
VKGADGITKKTVRHEISRGARIADLDLDAFIFAVSQVLGALVLSHRNWN